MSDVITREVWKYLDGLSATHEINVNLGTILSFGNNLFMPIEQPNIATCLTIIPYGGSSPNIDKYRQDSTFQIRLKARGIHSSMKGMQSIINDFHMNTSICASSPGLVKAIQSTPTIAGWEEDEYILVVSNYSVANIKL